MRIPDAVRSLLLPFALANVGIAQCGLQWQPGDPIAQLSGRIEASVLWDPDGAGPAPIRLVVGGKFDVGTMLDATIAAYDGTQWLPFGSPPPGGVVTALAVYGGQLVAATGAGSSPFGSVPGRVSAWNGTVNGAVPFSGSLYVGGNFTNAGGVAVSHLAVWNGTTWVAGASFNAPIETLVAVSGTSSATSWLYAGGAFTAIGVTPFQRIARFQLSAGFWTTMGSGFAAPCKRLFVRSTGISSFEVTAALETAAPEVFWRWTGTAWTNFGTLLDAQPLVPTTINRWNGQYVLGVKAAAAPVLACYRYDPTLGWLPLTGPGIDGEVAACCIVGNDTVIGGRFRTISGVAMNGIARGSAGAWQPLGSGFDGNVHALLVMPNGNVIAAGSFSTAGGVPANNIARWNGTSWVPLGTGTNGIVDALAILPNGSVIAAGDFTTAGGVPANNIARWNGTSWTPLASGLNSWAAALLALPNGDVVVAGNFTAAGGIVASRIARWNGASWSALGTGLSGEGLALATLPNGDIVAGGWFQTAGGVSAPHVARWNGSAWFAMSAGIGFRPTSAVRALTVLPDGDLVASGDLYSFSFSIPGVGTVSVRGNLARWESGTTWTSLGELGLVVNATALLPNGDLVAGGTFAQAEGVVSGQVARLASTCPASATITGAGCNGEFLIATSLPWANGAFHAIGAGLPPGSLVLVATGLQPVVPGLPLTAIFAEALPGCDLHVDFLLLDALVATNGTATSTLLLPDIPPIVGLVLHHQMIPLEFGPQGLLAVTATNALQLTVGIF